MHDFKIDNAKISFTDGGFVSVEYKVAMLAWKVEAGARLTNISVSGEIAQGKIEDASAVEYFQTIAVDQGATIENCTFDGIMIPSND